MVVSVQDEPCGDQSHHQQNQRDDDGDDLDLELPPEWLVRQVLLDIASDIRRIDIVHLLGREARRHDLGHRRQLIYRSTISA